MLWLYILSFYTAFPKFNSLLISMWIIKECFFQAQGFPAEWAARSFRFGSPRPASLLRYPEQDKADDAPGFFIMSFHHALHLAKVFASFSGLLYYEGETKLCSHLRYLCSRASLAARWRNEHRKWRKLGGGGERNWKTRQPPVSASWRRNLSFLRVQTVTLRVVPLPGEPERRAQSDQRQNPLFFCA